jgi:hypothetical protein
VRILIAKPVSTFAEHALAMLMGSCAAVKALPETLPVSACGLAAR